MFCLWGPAIVDVVASIAVVREAGSEAVFACEFPHRVRLSAADAGDPTGTELNRHAAETLLADPAADAVGGFEDHQVLHAVLGQHLRRGDSFKIRIKKTNTQWDWFEKASRKFNIETVVTVEERERERESVKAWMVSGCVGGTTHRRCRHRWRWRRSEKRNPWFECVRGVEREEYTSASFLFKLCLTHELSENYSGSPFI